MKNIAKTLIFALFALGSFAILSAPAEAAFPTILSATANIGETGVILNSSVNPNGYLTTAWFEYGTANDLQEFKETTHLDVGAGTDTAQFSGSITDLTPGTTYYFRVAANNGQRLTKSEILSFTTKITTGFQANTSAPKEETANTLIPIQEKTETKDNTESTNENKTGLESNAVFGMNPNFLPSTLTGWLVLLFVILCTLFVGRKLFYSNNTITVAQRKGL
jgi:hypothetical protein